MSGVFTKKFGRKYSCSPEFASSDTYSASSHREFFHVKYVYDWVNPILARCRITERLVKASARKITSRSTAWTSSISHSQNGNGLVWGLSTRNTFTPEQTQCRTMSFSASQNCASRESPS